MKERNPKKGQRVTLAVTVKRALSHRMRTTIWIEGLDAQGRHVSWASNVGLQVGQTYTVTGTVDRLTRVIVDGAWRAGVGLVDAQLQPQTVAA